MRFFASELKVDRYRLFGGISRTICFGTKNNKVFQLKKKLCSSFFEFCLPNIYLETGHFSCFQLEDYFTLQNIHHG